MRRIILFIVCFGCTMALLGNTPSSADSQFKAGNYLEAQKIYKALLKNYPSNALYLYRYARCAQELGDDTTAIQYFHKAGDRYTLQHLYMGVYLLLSRLYTNNLQGRLYMQLQMFVLLWFRMFQQGRLNMHSLMFV